MEISGIRLDIAIGELDIYRAPGWYIDSVRGYPLGTAGIILPDPLGELHRTIKVGDSVTIEVGYRNQVPVAWSGTVSRLCPGNTPDQLEVHAVNQALPLTTTRIVQSWENETAEAIVAWALARTGLPTAAINSAGITIPRFVASNTPVWQLVQQVMDTCHRQFGLDMAKWALWLGASGVNWGDLDEPGDTPLIATADNLIDHQPATSDQALSMIETFLLPDLMHSRRIHLQDDRRGIDTTFRAQRVCHRGTPDTARTFIWY